MSDKAPKRPKIDESERTALVTQLIELVQHQAEIIQILRDEIAVLKGNKPKPKIKPSGMEAGDENKKSPKKRPRNTTERSKTAELEIHETKVIAAENVPAGSTCKGDRYFVVQGLVIESHNIEDKLERWLTPDGDYVEAELPSDVPCHFNAEIICFILYQYHQCHVTQPLLLEQLREYGVDISEGPLNRLLLEGHECFDEEKAELLSTGLEVSPYIQVDDTGARHQGKTGVCTHIGHPWFESTESKSRINFLQRRQADHQNYILNEEALDYMQAQNLAQAPLEKRRSRVRVFADKEQWEAHLKQQGIDRGHHVRIATEGTLIGSLVEHGLNPD